MTDRENEKSEAVAKETYRRYITDILGYNLERGEEGSHAALDQKKQEVKP